MSDKTKIEWTDATWNPTTGCSKVSAGCKHCYAERDWARLSANRYTRYYGREFTDVQCHADVLDLPMHWARPRRIFVNSMSDLFHPEIPDEFIERVLTTTVQARQHIYQILTKRPERMAKLMRRWTDMNGRPQPNLWLGVSVEDQASADERIPLLLETPAAVRWISAEPLLGPVSLDCWPIFGEDDKPMLNWIVAGGESGPHARPMHPDWVRSLRDQCAAAGVPFLFKQWGEHDLSYDRDRDDPDCRDCGRMDRLPGRWINLAAGHGFHGERVHYAHRVGKKAAGRLLDGVAHDGYPE